MTPHKTAFRALSIAGSDSGGGAGIQADLKTFAALGCYGMSAITAVTAQNTLGVHAIAPVPVNVVSAQIGAVLEDIGANAIKIGMLFSAELIRAVADSLRPWTGRIPVVLDPVMVAQSGDALSQDDFSEALRGELLPLACLVTPNLPEAEKLLGREIPAEGMETAARDLASLGCPNVLLKGGHLAGEDCDDLLFLGEEQRLVRLPGKRILTRNNHGTGCTLSSAIAAGLARGLPLVEAVVQAKTYLTAALQAGAAMQIGQGHGPVRHFYALFPENPENKQQQEQV